MIFKNKAEEAAAKVLRAFENSNELPKPLKQVFINRNDGSPCRKWSWSNQLIVALSGFSEARGFRQWEKAGRTIKKGEKAIRILSPLIKKIEDEKTGEEKQIVYGFTGTPVFGLGQTEGEPLVGSDAGVQEWIESLPLVEVAQAWELSVEAFNGKGSKVLGSYGSRQGIALGVSNLRVWCHELVHAADDRNTSLSGSKLDKEIVAELGGAVLLTLLGYEYDADLGGCWQYICGHAHAEGREVLSICSQLLNRTCEAVSLILDTATEFEEAIATSGLNVCK